MGYGIKDVGGRELSSKYALNIDYTDFILEK
jgi:hypothetical protein